MVTFKSRIETFFQKDDSHTCETILWFEEEKHKFLRSENKVMFGFVYIPLNQSKYYDNSPDQLERDIINFQNSGYRDSKEILMQELNLRLIM